MSAQRFQAPTTIEALRRIKAELGPDAVVLSSNDVPNGVEIVAIAAADLVTLAPPPRRQAAPQSPAPSSGMSQRWANRLAEDAAATAPPFAGNAISQATALRASRDLPPRDEAELNALYDLRMPQSPAPAARDTMARHAPDAGP